MIDEALRPWLIEVNTNPCLELSGSYLSRLIPSMVENALKYTSIKYIIIELQSILYFLHLHGR